MRVRIGSSIAVAVTFALVAAGCGGDSSSGGDGRSFEFWSFTGINQKADVEAYRARHPDVEIS